MPPIPANPEIKRIANIMRSLPGRVADAETRLDVIEAVVVELARRSGLTTTEAEAKKEPAQETTTNEESMLYRPAAAAGGCVGS